MIEEVVNSILEAEDVAQQRVEAARQEAAEIVAVAETEADGFKKQSSADNKVFFAEESKKIEAEAAGVAAAKLAELNAQTDEEMKKYQINVQNAVKLILESF